MRLKVFNFYESLVHHLLIGPYLIFYLCAWIKSSYPVMLMFNFRINSLEAVQMV